MFIKFMQLSTSQKEEEEEEVENRIKGNILMWAKLFYVVRLSAT